MKVLVSGANGLVGRAMTAHCMSEGSRVIALDHVSLDITDEPGVNATIDRVRPDVVINCAAWTNVDGCELDPKRAQKANARGPELLALACRRIDALLITISTDYVFDGRKDGFYTQRDQPNPQSCYARSKLDGEHCAQQGWARTIVVRSGYIFGPGGTNFLSTVVRRALRGERLRAINDSFGTPTYARDLAQQLYRLAQLDLPGIYHVVNSGEGASFESFARAAIKAAGLADTLVESISLEGLNRPAPRPRNSRLRCLLSEAVGLEPLPLLQDSLRDFVAAESPAKAADILRRSV
ncbi:MAG TPA: dTDP-4-dehydrorhamnose reductase [Pyrinomonadaceae bacterium]|nr:dTDP-4-dehydrorhamnose reductase [Pyrinomonadaceae bacterium]